MTRRGLIGWITGTLVVLLGVVIVQPTRSGDYEKELVFAFWGGRWEAALKGALADFEREYGVKISWVAGSSVENLAKIQAQRGRPQIDVAIMDDIPALQGKKLGGWARLDEGALPNKAKLQLLGLLHRPAYFGHIVAADRSVDRHGDTGAAILRSARGAGR
jgi:spermidine/putrescine-binding protein